MFSLKKSEHVFLEKEFFLKNDRMSRFAASELGLHCLHMFSHGFSYSHFK